MHPEFQKDHGIPCQRIAIVPRAHYGPCARQVLLTWTTNDQGVMTSQAFVLGDQDDLDQANQHTIAPVTFLCRNIWPPDGRLWCKRFNVRDGVAHDGVCMRLVILEWYLDSSGKLVKSAVINGRVDDLESKYIKAGVNDDP